MFDWCLHNISGVFEQCVLFINIRFAIHDPVTSCVHKLLARPNCRHFLQPEPSLVGYAILSRLCGIHAMPSLAMVICPVLYLARACVILRSVFCFLRISIFTMSIFSKRKQPSLISLNSSLSLACSFRHLGCENYTHLQKVMLWNSYHFC